jgi:zeaxanthin glucosyltransferase
MNKKTIYIFLHQEVSGYNAVFKLAHELLTAGHRVIFVGNNKYANYVTNRGFEYKIIESEIMFLAKWLNQRKEALKNYKTLGKLPYRIQLKGETVRQISRHLLTKADKLPGHPPDLVLIDQFCMHHSLPFLEKGIPVTGLNTSLASSFHWTYPPVFSAIVPNPKRKITGYTRNFLSWMKIYITHVITVVYAFFNLYFDLDSPLDLLEYTAGKLIMRYGGKIQWWEYGTLKLRIPEIVMCPAEFDFSFLTRKQPSDTRCYVGTCVDIKRSAVPFDWEKIDKKKPLIYCSVGSHPDYCQHRVKLFRAVIQYLARHPGTQGILQIADQSEREMFSQLPGNAIISGWVPQLEVISRSSVFITHGGLSSVRESIYCGVPMIVFPWGVDQPGNAARVVFHHLGLKGNMKKITAKKLEQLINKLFHDNTYHTSIKKMQKIFKDQEDCKKGVEFINKVLSRQRH